MALKIFFGISVLLVGFFAFVGSRPGHFSYEKSGIIHAPPEKIFPYLSHLRLGNAWSPYEQVDPNMKKIFSGDDGQVGSKLDFDGNREAGSGHLEVLKVNPSQSVEIKLTMTKPFFAENLIVYKLTPEESGTRFSWTMSGDTPFMGKIAAVFIDCEKMVTDQFDKGISNLKTVVEAQK